MSEYKIITDSGCDLPKDMLECMDVKTVSLIVNFKGQVRGDSVDEGIREMYADLRAGEVATTSAVNPTRWEEAMEPELQDGKDLLVITFTSGLSTTYQSAVIAASELAERYPDRTIKVVDSLCASLGQGLLVHYAVQKKQEGLSLEELTAWLEENRYHLCHWFTVDDLMFLKRGGRVSATTALVGTMLKIKPVLHVDDEGHLISKAKARGRKASIEALAEKAVELGEGFDNSTMFICHGDCQEDAKTLEQMLRDTYGTKNIFIYYIGAVIGAHAGPGTMAVFFLGEHR